MELTDIDINTIFDRNTITEQITKLLSEFDERITDTTYKKGIYIYGTPGSGKTTFITNLLNKLNYNIVKYDAGDVRNKSLIETITSDNV